MKIFNLHALARMHATRVFAIGLIMLPALANTVKAQSGTDSDPFVTYYSQTRNCVRSDSRAADANGLSKGWSYECVAQNEVVFVLSLIDKCPSVAIDTVRRDSPDKKKIDVICIFLASDVKGSEWLSRKSSTDSMQTVNPSQPAISFDGCPAGSTRRIKKGFLGLGRQDYGCLTDYEYADIQARERASNANAWAILNNSLQQSKPAYCYGSSFTTGSYGMSQTTASASCF